MNMIYFTVAGVVGNVLWGNIYELDRTYGATIMYLTGAVMLAANLWFFVHAEGLMKAELAGVIEKKMRKALV